MPHKKMKRCHRRIARDIVLSTHELLEMIFANIALPPYGSLSTFFVVAAISAFRGRPGATAPSLGKADKSFVAATTSVCRYWRETAALSPRVMRLKHQMQARIKIKHARSFVELSAAVAQYMALDRSAGAVGVQH